MGKNKRDILQKILKVSIRVTGVLISASLIINYLQMFLPDWLSLGIGIVALYIFWRKFSSFVNSIILFRVFGSLAIASLVVDVLRLTVPLWGAVTIGIVIFVMFWSFIPKIFRGVFPDLRESL